MNATMETLYAKSLERAHADGCEVTLLESWGAHVSSASQPTAYYTIKFGPRNTMSCNCPAGERGNYCKHRALVRETLEVNAALARRDAQAAAQDAINAVVAKGWLEMTPDERAQMLSGLVVRDDSPQFNGGRC